MLKTTLFALMFTLCLTGVVSAAITVTGPDSGAVYHVGDTVHITWTSTDDVLEVELSATVDNGDNWLFLYREGTGWYVKAEHLSEWGVFNWVIPDTLTDNFGNPFPTVSSGCKIKLYDSYVTPSVTSFSKGTFNILPSVAVEKTALRTADKGNVSFNGRTLSVTANVGIRSVSVIDINGRAVMNMDGNALNSLQLPRATADRLSAGRYLVRVREMNGHSIVIPWALLK